MKEENRTQPLSYERRSANGSGWTDQRWGAIIALAGAVTTLCARLIDDPQKIKTTMWVGVIAFFIGLIQFAATRTEQP